MPGAAPSSCTTVRTVPARAGGGTSGAPALLVRATRKARANEHVQTPGFVLGAVAASGRAVVVRWVEGEREGAKAPSSGAFEQLFPVAPELA